MAVFSKIISSCFLGLIRIYRFLLSPMVGNCCRFYPSCSKYAMEAIEKHGAFYGFFLILKRLIKCHPMHPGGIDHVP
jgi:putative membrane protein insertion efficiency factor